LENIAGRVSTAILCIGAVTAAVINPLADDTKIEVAAEPTLSPAKPDPIERKERTPVRATPTLKNVIKKIRKPVSLKKEPKRQKAPKPIKRPAPKKTYGNVRDWARQQVGSAQFSCLDKLFQRESGWNTYATNPSSGAYGIPQALPASKMASAGADWKTNPFTQVRWGLNYIANRYGSPCGAWAHSQSVGWY
jgi:hypothetical protein